MYNLFVSGNTSDWNGDPWTVERGRCVREYTDEDLRGRFGHLHPLQVAELCRLPCVFAYERQQKDPKFGFVREVALLPDQGAVKVKYDLVECDRFITAKELEELKLDLGIRDRFEMWRTHWAVKDVDLSQVLLRTKGVMLPRERVDLSELEEPTGRVETGDDLWHPTSAPRVFLSHLADRKVEVHDLSRSLEHFGLACFVAHEDIEPSREWRREIERALNSCDLLVAYVTPGFSKSQWADQEVGWALGRRLAAIPVSVDGEMPYGFIGAYQAVTRTSQMKQVDLSRQVFRAICDAVFNLQRPGSRAVAEKVALLVVDAVGRASSEETARLFYELFLKIPAQLWTNSLRDSLTKALYGNHLLLSRVRPAGESNFIANLLSKRASIEDRASP